MWDNDGDPYLTSSKSVETAEASARSSLRIEGPDLEKPVPMASQPASCKAFCTWRPSRPVAPVTRAVLAMVKVSDEQTESGDHVRNFRHPRDIWAMKSLQVGLLLISCHNHDKLPRYVTLATEQSPWPLPVIITSNTLLSRVQQL